MPRRIYTYESGMGWDLWNAVSTGGAAILGFGVLVFVVNFFISLKKGQPAGADPWDGRTLEWSISSPPPEYNFEELPTVRGRDPFWEEKRRRVRAPVGGGSEDQGEHSIHLPQPSYWPLVSAIGLLIGSYGLVYSRVEDAATGAISTSLEPLVVAAIGGAITLIAVYAWSFEPVNEPDQHTDH